jgi:gamma-glutamylcyclotransferase (GGCT)/AIG2-like uncharacterized protein YtfP
MVEACDKLFVYGTLRRGFPLHAHLAPEKSRFLGRGKIRGRLYDLGEFPGAVDSVSSADEIEGELFQLLEPERLLAELDEIEEFDPAKPQESLFVRRMVSVSLPAQKETRAWAYLLAKKPSGLRQIPGGDYAEARRERS